MKAVRERARRNPKRSMRKMARDLKMDPKSMRTIVKTDLMLSFLKLKKRQHLTVLQKRKRAERADLLLNLLKSGTQEGKIVFSDELPSLIGWLESKPWWLRFKLNDGELLGLLVLKDIPLCREILTFK